MTPVTEAAMPSAGAEVMKRRHLDLLRVLAILAVFATHVILFCPARLLDSLVIAGHNVSWLLIASPRGG